MASRSSAENLKPLPPSPARHQHSGTAPLPQATQANVQRRYVERLEQLGQRRVTFLRDLAALSDTFTVWRYIYEQKPGSDIELGFLQHLVASLYEVILNSHPTWKHPNDERFRSTPGPFGGW